MTLRDQIAYLREAVQHPQLVSPDVAHTLEPFLNRVERLLDELGETDAENPVDRQFDPQAQ